MRLQRGTFIGPFVFNPIIVPLLKRKVSINYIIFLLYANLFQIAKCGKQLVSLWINKDLFKDELKLMKTSSKVENDKCFFSK